MSIPFECGFTMDGWTNALQVMLNKVKAIAKLDKLSVAYSMYGKIFEYGSPKCLSEKT